MNKFLSTMKINKYRNYFLPNIKLMKIKEKVLIYGKHEMKIMIY